MTKQRKYKYFKLQKKRKIQYLENNLNLFFPFLDINNSNAQVNQFNKINPGKKIGIYILV